MLTSYTKLNQIGHLCSNPSSLLLRFLAMLNALSIDVAIGALSSSLFAAKLLQAKLPMSWWWLLSGTVWVIYTTDHLLDAGRPGAKLIAFRHLLHRRRRIGLTIAVVIVGSSCVVGSATLPMPLLVFGVMLSGVVALYLIGAHSKRLMLFGLSLKEPLVALIYAIGVWGGPLLYAPSSEFSHYHLLALLTFTLLALINLYIISDIERESDSLLGVISAGLASSPDALKCRIYILTIITLLIALSLTYAGELRLIIGGATLSAMTMIHGAVLIWQHPLRAHAVYRIILDGTLVIPPLIGVGSLGW